MDRHIDYINKTNHAKHRMRQRGISDHIVDIYSITAHFCSTKGSRQCMVTKKMAAYYAKCIREIDLDQIHARRI